MLSFLKYSLLSIASIGVLISCGKESPLKQDQKDKLVDLQRSVSEVRRSAEASDRKRAFVHRRASTKNQNVNQKMVEQISQAECKFEFPDSIGTTSTSASFSYRISGDRCPITFDWGMRPKGNAVEVNMFFELKDEELAKLSDVTRYGLNGTLDKNGGKLEGYAESKKYGRVTFTVNLSSSESGATVEVQYKFTEFEATLKTESSKDGVKYYLNGEEVSKSEFETFNGEVSNTVSPEKSASGSGNGSNPSSSGHGTSTESYSYEIEFNDCSTGKHTFSSLAALCAGLQSKSLNNSCAEGPRRSSFTSYGCTGTFTPLP